MRMLNGRFIAWYDNKHSLLCKHDTLNVECTCYLFIRAYLEVFFSIESTRRGVAFQIYKMKIHDSDSPPRKSECSRSFGTNIETETYATYKFGKLLITIAAACSETVFTSFLSNSLMIFIISGDINYIACYNDETMIRIVSICWAFKNIRLHYAFHTEFYFMNE